MKNEKIKAKAIIFDLGNTLALYHGNQSKDLFHGHSCSHQKYCLNMFNWKNMIFGHKNSIKRSTRRFENRLLNWIETPLKEIISEFVYSNFGEQLALDKITTLIESYFSTTEPNWQPAPQLKQILEHLKAKNIKMGILSNACSDQNVQNIVDNLNIRQYFEYVHSSCALRLRKPHQDTFHKAISDWDIPKNEIWMVGDTLSQDIIGASSAGLSTIWITHGEQLKNPAATPTITLNNLHELISII